MFHDFKVYTPEDIGFLIELKKRIPRFQSHLKHILNSKCYFIATEKIIYLSELDINHAAEVTTEYLHYKCSSYNPRYYSAQIEFYCRIFRKALGFFGSKLINPRRRVKDEAYLTSISEAERPKGYRGFVSIDKRCAPFAIQHNQLIKKPDRTSREATSLQDIYHKDATFNFEISKKIGFILGDKIYRAFYSGSLSKADIRKLISQDLTRRNADPMEFVKELWWSRLKDF
jgi:hypothetical protein